MYIFAKLNIMRDHEYTAAIMSAGMLMTPPGLGPAFSLCYWAGIAGFGKCLEWYCARRPNPKSSLLVWEIECPRQAYLCEWYCQRFLGVYLETMHHVACSVHCVGLVDANEETQRAWARKAADAAGVDPSIIRVSVAAEPRAGAADAVTGILVVVRLDECGECERVGKAFRELGMHTREGAAAFLGLPLGSGADGPEACGYEEGERPRGSRPIDKMARLFTRGASTAAHAAKAVAATAAHMISPRHGGAAAADGVGVEWAHLRVGLPCVEKIHELDEISGLDQAALVFRCFDRNKSNSLSVDEIGVIFVLFGCPASSAREMWTRAGLRDDGSDRMLFLGKSGFFSHCRPLWQYCCEDMSRGVRYMLEKGLATEHEKYMLLFAQNQISAQIGGERRSSVRATVRQALGKAASMKGLSGRIGGRSGRVEPGGSGGEPGGEPNDGDGGGVEAGGIEAGGEAASASYAD